jgi:4-carboxymuconolactone decarboxylase
VRLWGGPAREIRPGDVVTIPAGARHWHGAAAHGGDAHLAIQEAQDGWVVRWMEQVSDEQYHAGTAERLGVRPRQPDIQPHHEREGS